MYWLVPYLPGAELEVIRRWIKCRDSPLDYGSELIWVHRKVQQLCNGNHGDDREGWFGERGGDSEV